MAAEKPVTCAARARLSPGVSAVFVLSLGTDEVLHVLAIYPPWASHARSVLSSGLSYRLSTTLWQLPHRQARASQSDASTSGLGGDRACPDSAASSPRCK